MAKTRAATAIAIFLTFTIAATLNALPTAQLGEMETKGAERALN